MKLVTARRAPRTALVAALSFGACAAMAAINLPKEGNFDATSCWSGTSTTIAHSKDYAADTYEMTGTVTTAVPGTLGDASSFRCVGMNVMMQGKRSGGNVCEVVDADGDKRLSRFSVDTDGHVTRQLVSGTGKYAGMEQVTKVANLGPYPDSKAGTFQGCNRQTGTYRMK